MKTMKKTMALLLALVMLFALAVPAMAATTTGTITINKAAEGDTYNAYLIFDLESYDKTKNAYSYKVHYGWDAFVTTGAGKDYVTVSNGYVTWNPAKTTGTDYQAFAEAAIAYAKASTSITAAATATCAKNERSVTMSGLALGYYVIETERSGANTLCILTTTDPTVSVDAKPEIPTPDKEVQEDSNETWGNTNDADIGQTVDFMSTINVKEGYTAYVMHDKMSTGLTFGSITKVELERNKTTTTVSSDNYTVTTNCKDKCTFEITFDENYCESLASGDKIIVYYTAVLNENAAIGGKGNPNDSWITYYHNNNEYESVKSETITYTWELKVFKYTETTINNKTEKTPLSGAQFELRRKAGETNTAIKFVDITSAEEGATPTYRAAKTDDDTTKVTTTITTDAGGKFILQGLDSDTYYLVETQAPAGYNKLEDPIMVKIDNVGKVCLAKEKDASGGIGVEYDYEELTDKTVGVVNNTGSKLPETGGVGTTVFYVLGAALVVGALVVLVTRKRMNNNG